MSTTYRVMLGFLVSDSEHSDVMDMFARMNGDGQPEEPTDGERTDILVDEIISEYPMRVIVDREVWLGVDKHSGDRYEVLVTIPEANIPSDTLENLADIEDCVDAAAWVVCNNEWEAEIKPLVD